MAPEIGLPWLPLTSCGGACDGATKTTVGTRAHGIRREPAGGGGGGGFLYGLLKVSCLEGDGGTASREHCSCGALLCGAASALELLWP